MGIAEKNKARNAVRGMMSTTAGLKAETTNHATEAETALSAGLPTEASEPRKKGRPVVKRETKKRYTLTFLPSVYDKASAKACEQGKSLSEVVGEFLSEYIKH